MALVQFAATRVAKITKVTKGRTSGHQQEQHKRRRLQKATPGCYFDTRFPSPGKVIGDDSTGIVGVESCLERRGGGRRADDDVLTGGSNHKQDCGQDQESSSQPRIGAHPDPYPHPDSHPDCKTQEKLQPPSNWNISDDSISLYSTHSSSTSSKNNRNMESEIQLRRRSCKTPVFFVGQLERKSVICDAPLRVLELDKAQSLADEYQAVLPLRLKTSFVNYDCLLEKEEEHDHSPSSLSLSYLPKTPKRLRKIKCQLSLRDVVRQHERCAPSLSSSPSTPGSGSDAETLVGSPPCSPLDGDFEKVPASDHTRQESHSQSQSHNQDSDSDSDSEHSLSTPNLDPETDIGLKICTELLTHELATALLRHHPATTSISTSTTETKDRASGLQILLMIEAYETVQSQVRRMLYDAHVTGKQFSHVRDAERILEHWLQALYAVYDREQEEEAKRERGKVEYEWPMRNEVVEARVVT